MDAGLLDVLHDAADDDGRAVADRVDVDLDGLLEELVDEHRLDRGEAWTASAHVAVERVVVVDDLHRAPAQHVAGAHEHRIADAARDLEGLGGGRRDAVLGLQQAELLRGRRWKCSRSSARSMDSTDVPISGAPARCEALGEVERRLPAELHDDPLRLHRSRTMFITSSCVSGSKKRWSEVS